MRTKVEIIKTTPAKGELSWAVVMTKDGTMLHDIPVSTMSYSKYKALIEKNHPEYDFIPEMIVNAPSPTIVEASTKYKTQDLKQAFDVSDVDKDMPTKADKRKAAAIKGAATRKRNRAAKKAAETRAFNKAWAEAIEENRSREEYLEKLEQYRIDSIKAESTNVDTDTVKEPSPQINNNDMNTNQEPVSEAQGATEKRRINYAKTAATVGKHGVKLGIQTGTVPLHAGLQMGAHALQFAANQVKNFEAFSIDKLNLTDSTRQEIKDNIQARTAKIEFLALQPIVLPIYAFQKVKKGMQDAKDYVNSQAQSNPQTA